MEPLLPWIVALIVLLLALIGAVTWRLTRERKTQVMPLPTDWSLAPRPVFSTDERRVYRQLREALPHHIVLSKLPLVRFCQPNDPQDVRYWYERSHRWNGVNYKPDFTIAIPGGGLAIEYFGLAGDPDYDEMSDKKRKYWEARDGWTLLEYGPQDITVGGIVRLVG